MSGNFLCLKISWLSAEKGICIPFLREQAFPAEMIAAAAARMAVVSVLIAFQILTFSIELYHYITRTIAGESSQSGSGESNNNGNALKKEISRPERRRLLLRHGLALFVGLLSAILALAIFTGGHSSGAPDMEKMISECSSPTVDADIAGEGIRIAIWAQETVLLVICVLGVFHGSATGGKEIGVGIAITHVALAVALLIQMSGGSLTPSDAIIGAMILDSQNNALSLQFVTKETLAARWQIYVVTVCQAFGLAILPFFVHQFAAGSLATSVDDRDCPCISAFLWGRLSDCSAFPSREAAAFWVYYTCRIVMCMQCWAISIVNAPYFHHGEKEGRSLAGISFAELAAPAAPPRSPVAS